MICTLEEVLLFVKRRNNSIFFFWNCIWFLYCLEVGEPNKLIGITVEDKITNHFLLKSAL